MKREQFWSKEERLKLLNAIRTQRGFGRWDRIAEQVTTRTPSQCRKQWERLRLRLRSGTSAALAGLTQLVSLSGEQEEQVCQELERIVESDKVEPISAVVRKRKRKSRATRKSEEDSFDEAVSDVTDEDLDVVDAGEDIDSKENGLVVDQQGDSVAADSTAKPRETEEGRRIEHVSQRKRRSTRANQMPANATDNPFQLIDLEKSSAMTLEMHWSVMFLIDLHAHLSRRAEIIGLLGGNLESSVLLRIDRVHPCRSVGTEIECEMDPVSEMHACQQLAEEGRALIGWYHSHPTFRPSPSLRDLETQAMYQRMLQVGKSDELQVGKSDELQMGTTTFIGIIVSPWATRSRTNPSDWECFYLDAGGQAQRCAIRLSDHGENEEYRNIATHLLLDYPQADLTVIRDKIVNRREWTNDHRAHIQSIFEARSISSSSSTAAQTSSSSTPPISSSSSSLSV